MADRGNTWVNLVLRLSWSRILVAFGMFAEGVAAHISTSSVLLSIGGGMRWHIAFMVGGVALLATLVMPPGWPRAVLAAIPISVQLSRGYAVWHAGLEWYSGGVVTRVSLAAMMIAALGWSPASATVIRRESKSP